MLFPERLYQVEDADVRAFPPELRLFNAVGGNFWGLNNFEQQLLVPADSKRILTVQRLALSLTHDATAAGTFNVNKIRVEYVDKDGAVLGLCHVIENYVAQAINSFGYPGLTTQVNATFTSTFNLNLESAFMLPTGIGLRLWWQIAGTALPLQYSIRSTALCASFPTGSIGR